MRYALSLLLLFIPVATHAAIVINEVAWMGSAASANHEWIELRNTGTDSVDVSGWKLSDGMNLLIELAGVIPAGSYAVLERSSEDSASGAAFLVYTGALVNTGATLSLTRADGGLEDQIAGGENWQNIGGDNVTKETAQYTTAGWVTGAGTPGTQNSGVQKPKEDTEETTTNGSGNGSKNGIAKSSPANETVKLTLPGVTLALVVEGQKVGYVNQSIEFLVTPSGVGKTIAESLAYDWNFGDGATATGKGVRHAFLYPGKYVVTVYGQFKRQEQVARYEVTILPVALSLTRSDKGDIQINNDSPYEIDISGYTVSAHKRFTFPAYSVLLPNQTITLSRQQIGNGFVTVVDASDMVVVHELQANTNVVTPVSSVVAALRSTSNFASTASPDVQSVANEPLSITESITPSVIKRAEASVGSSTRTSVPSDAMPYIGLIGTILLGLVGLGIKANRNQNP